MFSKCIVKTHVHYDGENSHTPQFLNKIENYGEEITPFFIYLLYFILKMFKFIKIWKNCTKIIINHLFLKCSNLEFQSSSNFFICYNGYYFLSSLFHYFFSILLFTHEEIWWKHDIASHNNLIGDGSVSLASLKKLAGT